MKKIEVKKYEGHYFYKVHNFLPEGLIDDLYSSSVKWLTDTRKSTLEEVFPPESSADLLTTNAPEESVWKCFYSEVKKHIAKYCEITNTDINTIKLSSSWITRLHNLEIFSEDEKKSLERRSHLHNTFGNMHSHEKNPIGIIYYLKNPNPKYGTLVKISENKLFNNNGEENSALIFNPILLHTALYPKLSVSMDYPRITIVADCIEID